MKNGQSDSVIEMIGPADMDGQQTFREVLTVTVSDPGCIALHVCAFVTLIN